MNICLLAFGLHVQGAFYKNAGAKGKVSSGLYAMILSNLGSQRSFEDAALKLETGFPKRLHVECSRECRALYKLH